MKYFALFSVLSVLASSGTAAAHPGSSNDGTLSVKNADGKVVFIGRGLAIGRFDKGQVTIKDPNPNDGSGPIVTGADSTQSLSERTTRYSGTKIRFRIIGGAFTVIAYGQNVDISVIGKGLVTLDGSLSAKGNADAACAVNDDDPAPFPTFKLTFPLDATTSGSCG